MAEERDTLARRKRLHPVSTGKRVTPNDRDLLWFTKLREHGPLPTSFLLQYCAHMRGSEKRSRERLTDLFNEDNTPDNGRYLLRPPQQFRTLDSRYNQLVYDLAPAAERALARDGLSSSSSNRHTGPWLHSFMVSCVTASVELAALARGDINYIPQSQILVRAKTELRWPTRFVDPASKRLIEKDLLPDALFGLEYLTNSGSRYRFFAVECDRATEPATTANFNRKSVLRNLLQHEDYTGGGYRKHLNLTAPLLVLNIASDPARMRQCIDLTAKHYPSGNAYMLYQVWEDFGVVFRPPEPRPALLVGDWLRGGLAPFWIDRAQTIPFKCL